MTVEKGTICGGGNGAQTMVPIAARNLGCAVDLYAPHGDEAERLRAGLAGHGGLEAILLQTGSEVQAIRARPESALDLSAVRPLFDWLLRSYGDAIAGPSGLRSAFVANQAYAGLQVPVRKLAPNRFVPDFGTRDLAEDVSFGLAVSRATAVLAKVETPVMDRLIIWAGERLGTGYLGRDADQTRRPQNYGLDSWKN